MRVDGRSLVNFCSNDYLGLANHPELVSAAQAATQAYGFGGGASHLVCGHSHEHHALEEELAEFTGRDRVLLFSTGYMANIGVLQALLDRHASVFEDKLNHASLLDGAQICRAKRLRYAHVDMAQLDRQLLASKTPDKLIVTDGVFSMDGDMAPLPELSDIALRHHAMLMVDDAHGFGVLGENGGGLQEHFGLSQDQLPVLVGTLGKAFGSFGAFVAGSEDLIEYLIQFARSYIYTTSMPPAVAAATRAALHIIQTEKQRREHLWQLISYFKQCCNEQGIHLMPSDTPIQPILVGDDGDALALSQSLKDKGLWVSAIRPPTVPEGSARLRVTLSAAHTRSQIDLLVECLSDGLAPLR